MDQIQRIPFELNGHGGQVSVSYGRNEDPKLTGYDYLVELGLEKEFDFSMCVGFPVMHAKVDYFQGYRSLLGWIQIVKIENVQGKSIELIHDKYPSFSDIDFPFGSFGYLPSVFDAPSTWNPEKRKNSTWVANTFLTTFPILSRQIEEISWVCGFRWGYYFDDDPKLPKISPLALTTADSWNENLSFLRNNSKTWRFKEG